MLKFNFNEEKSDERFEFYECERWDTRITIIKSIEWGMCSVFVKREVQWEFWWRIWYIELANHRAATIEDAKKIAENLYEKVLQINLD